MKQESMGFIGGGRVVRVLLGGLQHAAAIPKDCVVTDANPEVLQALEQRFPGIRTAGADIAEAARQDLVFGALHPPVLGEVLSEIGKSLKPEAIFVSLAPKLRLGQLAKGLGGFDRIARLIPNAPSIVQSGFNPISFSDALSEREKSGLLTHIEFLGECPEVADEDLEAYAILTAMGPTYFWYQFEELAKLGSSFGLPPRTAQRALSRMLHGAVDALFESNLSTREVMDLIPVRPMEKSENTLREAYRTNLTGLHNKLTAK
jgi:pyrroline-5-carboxylate reductase